MTQFSVADNQFLKARGIEVEPDLTVYERVHILRMENHALHIEIQEEQKRTVRAIDSAAKYRRRFLGMPCLQSERRQGGPFLLTATYDNPIIRAELERAMESLSQQIHSKPFDRLTLAQKRTMLREVRSAAVAIRTEL